MLPEATYEYIASGAADEHTLRWNREAFQKVRLRPRVLRDVTNVDTTLELLGQRLECPIILAPASFHGLYHPEGEIATAKGAGAAKTIYTVSSFTTTRIEEIAKVATQPLWFQLYFHERPYVKDLVQTVEAAGCKALCLTVDLPVVGIRNRSERAGFQPRPDMPAPYLPEGLKGHPVTWDDVEWLRSITKMPVLLKGVLNPEDARIGVKAGAGGIIVSNHGARDLDTLPATLDALPGVVEAVQGSVPVLMDGGIRRGTDVVKALALGAKAVLIGRPYCYGLAAGGAEGVRAVIEILKNELVTVMQLLGVTSIREIDRSVLWQEVL